ncbi:MAG: family 43 glycosylhydrolase [Oscillospiraceae bacterium]|nr:family 43 glycosylhydrolase [Oscillospiraceae bacterium]
MKQPVYNPFLPLHEYIPDGEPHVFGDRVYLFGSHDKEGGDTFCMLDYTVWSAPVTDLSDWRCEGTIYKASQDPLYNEERPYMYAPDVVQGNDGRYYLFYCLSGRFGVGGYHGPISVAVCDTPAGAYEYLGFVRYPDGSPMKTYVCFDPGVLNDGGTIRLYYGTQYPFEEQEGFAENEELIRQEMEMFGKSREEILGTPESVMGPSMCVLEDDMLTVRGKPVHIIPYRVRGTSFEGHPFFEAPSMRKIGRKYYFIYSSQLNHELCYAVSDKPDRDFVYGGTIVSNGDVGYLGRTQEQRLNMTGTTHGSIVEIAGQWYVFYHRLTHKSDYSRQACAERITIRPDGSIPQVPITSCGLGEPLPASGTYPAAIACHITNGHMPHGSNSVYETRFPHVTHAELPDGSRERFVAEISDPTLLGFKYFRLHGNDRLVLRLRGTGDGVFSVHLDPAGPAVGMIPVAPHTDWTQAGVQLQAPAGTTPLYLIYHGTGEVSLLDLSFPGAPGKKETPPREETMAHGQHPMLASLAVVGLSFLVLGTSWAASRTGAFSAAVEAQTPTQAPTQAPAYVYEAPTEEAEPTHSYWEPEEDLRFTADKDLPAGRWLLIPWREGSYYTATLYAGEDGEEIIGSALIDGYRYVDVSPGEMLGLTDAFPVMAGDEPACEDPYLLTDGQLAAGYDVPPGEYTLVQEGSMPGVWGISQDAPLSDADLMPEFLPTGSETQITLDEGDILTLSHCRLTPPEETAAMAPGGYYPAGNYTLGEDLPEGMYVVINDGSLHHRSTVYVQQFTSPGRSSLSASPSYAGETCMYIDLQRARGQFVTVQYGSLYPMEEAPMPDPYQHDGMYLAGRDLAPGTYTVTASGVPGTGHDRGSFAVVDSADPTERLTQMQETRVELSSGESASVTLEEGEYLDMRYCRLLEEE